KCAGPADVPGRADLGITTVTDDVPDDTLPSRVHLIVDGKGVEGQVIEIRSRLQGYTLTADSLPVRVGTPTSETSIAVAWSVVDCDLATSTESLRQGTHFSATIRTENGGLTGERSVQNALSEDVALQLGLLAASSCSS